MRERFVLACRIVGLVVFCAGLLYTAMSLRMFVDRYDITRAMPPDALRDINRLTGGNFEKDVRHAQDYTWQWICVSFLVGSVAPLALGLYLMKSGRIFIKLCYPDEKAATARPLRAPPQTEAPEETKLPQSPDDSKYMPPGM
ncbi:MAG: hypothetical protein ACYS8Z_23130 [Planctomycetota bacterium]|jgi:hypothetical protein